jgi:hypothetical protein
MLYVPKNERCLDRLKDELRLARTTRADFFAKIIVEAFPAPKRAPAARLIHELVEAGAWTDAALALVEIGPPGWKLRRLVRENGEWFCSLTREPNLPAQLDDSADAWHEMLPLAILSAVIEVLHTGRTARTTGVPALRQAPPTSDAVSCDSFA